MSSYAIDPSAWTFANNGAGHGLWGTTSTLAAPTLATPGGSGALATGLSAAATPAYSLTGVNTTAQTTPTTSGTYNSVAPASITAPSYATSSQQVNSAAATAAASPVATSTAAATPAASKLAYSTKSKLGIAVNTPALAVGGAQSLQGITAVKPVVTTYTPSQTIIPIGVSTYGGINTYAQWDAASGQYLPMTDAQNQAQSKADYQTKQAAALAAHNADPAHNPMPAIGQPLAITDLGTVNSDAAKQVAAAAAQKAALANAYNNSGSNAAIRNTTVTAAPTVQGANYDFSSAFNHTDQSHLNAATVTAQQAQNALASQLSTNNYQSGNIAAGARYGAAEAVDSAGKNQLALQTAAATDTNNNLTQFGNALTAQSAAASSFTGAQAQSDISSIQDDVTALTSQLGTLNSATQANVATQLNALQDQINKYNEAVQQAGADSSLAKKIFAGVLAAGAIVAAAATGGAATPAAVAATANAATTIAS